MPDDKLAAVEAAIARLEAAGPWVRPGMLPVVEQADMIEYLGCGYHSIKHICAELRARREDTKRLEEHLPAIKGALDTHLSQYIFDTRVTNALAFLESFKAREVRDGE